MFLFTSSMVYDMEIQRTIKLESPNTYFGFEKYYKEHNQLLKREVVSTFRNLTVYGICQYCTIYAVNCTTTSV